MAENTDYNDDNIRSLDWKEHIRLRPGMYIGKLGDGSAYDDGVYVLLKEIIDNSIDEFVMGAGKTIEVSMSDHKVSVRDYGRGIPLGKVIDCVSKINTGGKYDSKAFQKSVGLNVVGTKAVNALSNSFIVQSFRDGRTKAAEFVKGELVTDEPEKPTSQRNGTAINFIPDDTIFRNYRFIPEFVESMIWNYVFLNSGLTLNFNGQKYFSERGLYDLLTRNTDSDTLRYPIIHLKGEDIEIAMTHGQAYGEEYYSFVNGQHTTQGGTHQAAVREAIVKTIREFYDKDFDASDIRGSIVSAIAIKVQEPVFESQTKTKLGSQTISPEGNVTLKQFVTDFLKKELDNFLHKHPEVADALQKRILQSERERKDMAGIKKLANERAKKASLHNRKLRDCKLGSQNIGPEGPSVRAFIGDFIKRELDNYLHKNPATADALKARILQSERERKEISGIKKLANERAKKASLHNRKLRDCKVHFEDTHERRQDTTLFITEGDSASGSITKSRDVLTQAVFSL